MKTTYIYFTIALTAWTFFITPMQKSPQFVSIHSDNNSELAKLYKYKLKGRRCCLEELSLHAYFINKEEAGNHKTQSIADARDRALYITNLKTRQTIHCYALDTSHNRHTCVAFNSEGSLLIAGYNVTYGSFPTILIWNAVSGKLVGQYNQTNNHQEDVTAVTFLNHDGTKFASGSKDGKIKLWDRITDQVTTIQGHNKAIIALACNYKHLASLSDDSTIKIWNLATTENTQTFNLHQRQTIIGFFPKKSIIFSKNPFKETKTKYWLIKK